MTDLEWFHITCEIKIKQIDTIRYQFHCLFVICLLLTITNDCLILFHGFVKSLYLKLTFNKLVGAPTTCVM